MTGSIPPGYGRGYARSAVGIWRRPLPVTEAVAQEILSLPFHPEMTGAEAEAVVEALADAVRGRR